MPLTLGRFSRRASPPEPRFHVPAPANVPAIERAEAELARGHYGEAVLVSYRLVLADFQRAYGLNLLASWTYRDFLERSLRSDMGRLPELLIHLTTLYEPARFGRLEDWIREDLLQTLRLLYSETSLLWLYRSDANPPEPSRPQSSAT